MCAIPLLNYLFQTEEYLWKNTLTGNGVTCKTRHEDQVRRGVRVQGFTLQTQVCSKRQFHSCSTSFLPCFCCKKPKYRLLTRQSTQIEDMYFIKMNTYSIWPSGNFQNTELNLQKFSNNASLNLIWALIPSFLIYLIRQNTPKDLSDLIIQLALQNILKNLPILKRFYSQTNIHLINFCLVCFCLFFILRDAVLSRVFLPFKIFSVVKWVFHQQGFL